MTCKLLNPLLGQYLSSHVLIYFDEETIVCFTGKMQALIQREIWDRTESDGKGIDVGVC